MDLGRRSRTQVPGRVRCAIYSRKSNVEGLDSDFSSLDAQREACASYIQSQAGAGWVLIPKEYSDGGYTGANTDRPGFQKLLADIETGKIDAVVVYKIDRLSRSLRDFGRLMDTFERHNVSFISVTQRFDTSSSMGKLTLNILMSFAEFEREVIGERIRDKVAAAKRKGKHTGGMPILGFNVDSAAKRLVVNAEEARLVRRIFQRFVDTRSTTELAAALNREGSTTKAWTTVRGVVRAGGPWNKAHLYRLLNNRKYIGEIEHKGKVFPGEHEAIVPRPLWDAAQRVLAENYRARAKRTREQTPALLRGIIKCAHCGCSMGPTFTRKAGRTYRYYLCVQASKRGYESCPVRSVAAGEIEAAVVGQLRALLKTPELVAKTYREAKSQEREEIDRLRELEQKLESGSPEAQEGPQTLDEVREQLHGLETNAITERDVLDALHRLDPVWDELFPAEQARIVQLLVERVEVQADGLEVRLRADGLRSLVTELGSQGEPQRDVAG